MLDARRAVFFPMSRTLAVADLHLGYAGAKRTRGALLPITDDDTVERLGSASELVFCLGNHDRRLEQLVRDWRLPVICQRQLALDGHLLLHGDVAPQAAADEPEFRLESPLSLRCVIGHEHPSIALGDGVTTRVKCPAFLVADDLLVLLAFSSWAAGCEFGRPPFLGPLARAAKFHTAFACLGPRLLKLPL